MNHPSYLELDRLSLGAARFAATAAHVATCDRCAGHLAALHSAPPVEAGLAERRFAAADAADAGGFVRRLLGARRPRLFGAAALVGAAGLAAILLPVRFSRTRDSAEALSRSSYVGSKGLPSVWIYVKRDADLALWDGRRPLRAGDRLRLKIDPQGHTHADVFTRDEGGGDGALVPVFSGRLAAGAVTTLPTAWQLDGTGRRDTLIVVLSDQEVSAAEARRLVERGAPPGVWLRRFELWPISSDEPRRTP